eukprot:SAG11_NODE_32068_length_286_cov_1.652406_1_plen_48_part_01
MSQATLFILSCATASGSTPPSASGAASCPAGMTEMAAAALWRGSRYKV